MLSAHVPDLEVHIGQVDGGDVLADGGHGFGGRGWVRGEVEGFDGGEERRFAGVVEAEEEDRVFCGCGEGVSGGWGWDGMRGGRGKGWVWSWG